MTLEEFIKHNKGILKQINGGEEVLNYLGELKDLREKYKNVSEAFMKVNNSIFGTKMDLNKVKQENDRLRVELEKNSKELENAKSVAEFQQKSNMEREFRIKELEEELKFYKDAYKMACRELGYANKGKSTESWNNYFLQKAREEL